MNSMATSALRCVASGGAAAGTRLPVLARPRPCRAHASATNASHGSVISHERDDMPSCSPRCAGPFPGRRHGGEAALAAAAVATVACLGGALPADALELVVRPEPANALSLPTWAIHVSSVVEWAVAMGLMWRFAEATGNERWKGMAWGMLPCLGSAMCACSWHFFYNSPELEWMVALQAGLTVVGNFTCWIAAYRIYAAAQGTSQSS